MVVAFECTVADATLCSKRVSRVWFTIKRSKSRMRLIVSSVSWDSSSMSISTGIHVYDPFLKMASSLYRSRKYETRMKLSSPYFPTSINLKIWSDGVGVFYFPLCILFLTNRKSRACRYTIPISMANIRTGPNL